MIVVGDCVAAMREMDVGSVDAIVTDPPYGLAFMGKKWDYDVPGVDVFAECFRVLKPGGRLLCFAGTRTMHRMWCNIEDAGFTIEDTIAWMYGSGFPKHKSKLKPAYEPVCVARKGPVSALNIDECRIEGGARPLRTSEESASGLTSTGGAVTYGSFMVRGSKAVGETLEGRWPANVVLDEEAARVLDVGTGDLKGRANKGPSMSGEDRFGFTTPHPCGAEYNYGDSGGASRFFYCAKASRSEREAGLDGIKIITVEILFPGETSWENEARKVRLRVDTAQSPPRVIAASSMADATAWSTLLFGSGSAAPSLTGSRFTIETRTSSTTESRILNSLMRSLTSACIPAANSATVDGGSRVQPAENESPSLTITNAETVSLTNADSVPSGARWRISESGASPADHPTVKPIELMRWLVRLVTPAGGVVLDPFAGSGTTGIAAVLEGREFIGIEREAEYAEIAERRIKHWLATKPLDLFNHAGHPGAERRQP